MFPRQRPSSIKDVEGLQRYEGEKMQWYVENRQPHAWPWSVLRSFQKKYDLPQTGCRELQNWRVAYFLKHPHTPIKHVIKHSVVPQFTRLPYVLKFRLEEEASLLFVHNDVLKKHILVHLVDSPLDLFSLMFTCRTVQAACQELLCQIAQQRYGPLGTPKALHFAETTKMATIPRGDKRRKKDLDGLSQEKIRDSLHLVTRDFKSSNIYVEDVDNLVCIAIRKYGCLENFDTFKTILAQTEAAREAERVYIQECVPERLKTLNTHISKVMKYEGISLEEEPLGGKLRWSDPRVPLIFWAFQNGTTYQTDQLLKSLREWVNMQVEHSISRACSRFSFYTPIEFNTAIKYMHQATTLLHPLLPYLIQILMDIKQRNYFFYDDTISREEWLQYLAFLFSPTFSTYNPIPQPEEVEGSWVCCWQKNKSYVRLYRLSSKVDTNTIDYYNWMRMIENRYHIRLASPSTGIPYSGLLPQHYIKESTLSSFGHALLIKK